MTLFKNFFCSLWNNLALCYKPNGTYFTNPVKVTKGDHVSGMTADPICQIGIICLYVEIRAEILTNSYYIINTLFSYSTQQNRLREIKI